MLMLFAPFDHQPGVRESIRMFDYQFHLPNLRNTASKERILKDSVGFLRIIWALTKKNLSPMFVTP